MTKIYSTPFALMTHTMLTATFVMTNQHGGNISHICTHLIKNIHTKKLIKLPILTFWPLWHFHEAEQCVSLCESE